MAADIEQVGSILCMMLVGASLIVFVLIQLYLNDPRRRELNERWFAEFLSNQQRRYSEHDLGWRIYALTGLFKRASN